MKGFVDESYIEVASGNGGHGSVSFRREKYAPNGGPDGGDGGNGGNLIFRIKSNVKTLSRVKSQRVFRAKNGQPGKGRKKFGPAGDDSIVEVPPGTLVFDAETNELIVDLTNQDEYVYLKGGKGGKGNVHFKSSTRQAPTYAQPGLPGVEKKLRLELNIIADIGLVGLPNAGKSSLQNVLTNANPKIAAYPFTTMIPNLGVYRTKDRDIVIADIPGILEGANQGVGLGFDFLKHISRTKVLVFLIDLSDDNYASTLDILKNEVEGYSKELAAKNYIIVATKLDIPEALDNFENFKKQYPNEQIYGISTFGRLGLDELGNAFLSFA